MARVLFVRHSGASFVAKDIHILRGHELLIVDWRPGWHVLPSCLRIMRALFRTDVCFARATGSYAVALVALARLVRVPSLLVIGGYEVQNMPQIGYGALSNRKERWMALYCLRHASKLVPVATHLGQRIEDLVPEARGRINVVPNGFPPSNCTGPKKKDVVIIAGVSTRTGAMVKGLDGLGAVARCAPDCKFVVLGASGKAIEAVGNVPDNVYFEGPKTHSKILEALCDFRVVLQMSRTEGHPNGVCEAMAAGAVPVIVDIPGALEIAGEAGFVVPRDPDLLAEAIRKAQEGFEQLSKRSKDRIQDMFSLRAREMRLANVIDEVQNL